MNDKEWKKMLQGKDWVDEGRKKNPSKYRTWLRRKGIRNRAKNYSL